MLLRVMFLIAFIGILAETVLQASAALSGAALHYRAAVAADGAMRAALASAQYSIERQRAAGGDPQLTAFASAPPTCVAGQNAACLLYAQTTIAALPVVPNSGPTCAGSACTVYMQGNDNATEGRMAVRIATSITSSGGTTLASRYANASFRTLALPPYAILAGTTDTTITETAAHGNGDDGGAVAHSALPGTLLLIDYLDATNPAATPIPGNVWQPVMQNPAGAAPLWDK